MPRGDEVRVGEPPERPLVVFDGDCGFCRQWIDRWRSMTGDRVEYRPFQEVAGRYPEVGRDRFGRGVWLIEPDGRALGGARAALRLYGLAGEKRWLAWLYDRVPAVAATAEWAYQLVAQHRGAADMARRLLWGDISRRPRYRRMRAALLRALALVYLAAFGSLAVQVDGLIGSRGILPAADYLERAREVLDADAPWQLPTVLWLDASDRAIHLLCWGGVVLSLLAAAGVFPGPCLALLWVSYLSLTVVGQEFLGYQWDALLLEAGLLAVLFAPWGPWLGWARREPSRGAIWLLRWLVFRLMLLSGLVKLASGDPTWRAWEALKYHYETQPLPTWTSWYAHRAPAAWQVLSVGFMFWAEIVAPFLIFGPRRLRLVAFWSIVLLQAGIAATGNYGFFNLLTVVLCLSLLEDRDLGARGDGPAVPSTRGAIRRVLIGVVGALIVALTTVESLERIDRAPVLPPMFEWVRRQVAPLRSLNAYGLFAVMTTERPEVIVEGSRDGETWTPYRFRWKPGDVDRAPRFATPHMPRLDWQLWFAALSGDGRRLPWFLQLERRLLEGSPAVLRLLDGDPFDGRPPRYIRARLFLYRFTRPGSKDWWEREEIGTFCPPMTLRRRPDEGAP